ncbi:MAG: permease-like cell division protein FtsX [Gallionella sp.]
MLQSVLRRIFNPPVAGLLNIMVIGIALSLPVGMYVLLQNAQGLLQQFSSTPQLSVFLNLTAKAEDIDKLRKQFERHPAIASVEFVGRDAALQQLKQNTELDDVISGLNNNPLPDAFLLQPNSSDPNTLNALRSELSNLPNVEIAQLDSAWAYKLAALLKFANIAVLILASLLSLALVAITFNTIRLQILTQRDEIEVSKLIGASNRFIRRPFLYFGAVQGLLGGLTAYALIAASLALLNIPLATLSQLYASSFTLHGLSMGDSVSLLLFSLYLGWLGAWLSVSKHLAEIEPR